MTRSNVTPQSSTANELSEKDVVSIFSYQHHLRFPALKTVETYWQGLRHQTALPKRSDIDPRGIEDALEYAFIGERIAAGMARLRIAGMHLSELLGLEVRGMPVASFVEPQDRQRLADALETVFAQSAIVEITLRAEGRIGQPPLDGKMILLPLLDDMGDVTRVLGALVTRGKIGRGPRRCTIVDVSIKPFEVSSPQATKADQDDATAQQKLETDLATIRAMHAKRNTSEAKPALTLINCEG